MIDTTTNSRFSVKQLIVIYTIISLLSLLAVWELAARFTSASMFLPPASQVLAAFGKSFVEPIGKRTMLAHIGVSLYRVAVAFFFATIAGIALGVGMGYSRLMEAVLKPVFEFIRPIPPLAWIPLSILWFGLGGYGQILYHLSGLLLFHHGEHLRRSQKRGYRADRSRQNAGGQ